MACFNHLVAYFIILWNYDDPNSNVLSIYHFFLPCFLDKFIVLHAAQNWDIFLTFQHWKMSSRLRQINKLFLFKGELHSNDIFLHFALIGLEWDSITLFTKRNVFSSKTHISKRFAQDIYGLLFTNVNIF